MNIIQHIAMLCGGKSKYRAQFIREQQSHISFAGLPVVHRIFIE